MERTNVRREKGDEPPDPKKLNFTMTYLRPSGKNPAQVDPGKPPEGGCLQGGGRPTMAPRNGARIKRKRQKKTERPT